MSICWYCYWGWAKSVAEIYQQALAKLDGCEMALDYGPGHIVWADENFEDDHINWCLSLYTEEGWRKAYGNRPEGKQMFREFYSEYSDHDLEVAKESLEQLLAVPENVRCPEPENYDGENPQSFPPSVGVEMVKKQW